MKSACRAPQGVPAYDLPWQVIGDHAAAVRSAAFWPGGGEYVLSASEDAAVIAWRLADRTAALTVFSAGRCAAAHPQGELIACGASDGRIVFCDALNGSVTRVIEAHTGPINAVVFGSDGAWVASASEDQSIIVTDTASGELVELLTAHTGSVQSLSLSADGSKLLSASADGSAMLWSTSGWSEEAHIEVGQPIDDACCAPDGGWALLSGTFGLRLWRDGEIIEPAPGLTAITAVAASPDAQLAAAGSGDGQIRVYGVNGGANGWSPLATLPQHPASITVLTFSADGDRLVAAAADGRIRMFSVEPLKEAARVAARSANRRSPRGETRQEPS